MNFFTHISISITLYKILKKKVGLDKTAFMYGNVKPDLNSRCMQKPHTLENYFAVVCEKADRLMNEEMPLKEFSEELGVICHYVSDFFCHYHLNEEIFHELKGHFMYELKLHFEYLKIKPKINLELGMKETRRSISSIIMELLDEYSSKLVKMEKDIKYTLSTALWICESIYYFCPQSSKVILDNVDEAYQVMTIAGGQ